MGVDNDHNFYYNAKHICGMECPVDGCDYQSDTKHGIAIHCGKSHKNANLLRVDCECNYCGDTFTIPKSRYENGVGKHCSRECRRKNQTEKRTVDCECNYCGDTFTIAKSRYESGRGKHCSRECKEKNKAEKRTVGCECNYCGDTFTVPKSHYENGWGKYCSRECYGLDNRCSNPDIRKSAAYQQFRKTVLNRDNHSCVDCGASDTLHVHHITPISEDESQATDVGNGVTVCIPCHADRHEQRGDDAIASSLRAQNTAGFEIGVIDSQQTFETFADD